MKFGGRFFQEKLFSHLSHKVGRRVSLPVLLRKFTSVSWVRPLADEQVYSFRKGIVSRQMPDTPPLVTTMCP